jgi:hypothetical protein
MTLRWYSLVLRFFSRYYIVSHKHLVLSFFTKDVVYHLSIIAKFVEKLSTFRMPINIMKYIFHIIAIQYYSC